MNAEPLRRLVLERAHAEAKAALADAEARGAAEVERFRAETAHAVERARSEGAAAGELEAGRLRAAARREARRRVLEAQQAAYDEFRLSANEAVLALRADEAYGALLADLSAAARTALGDAAALEVDPDRLGGVRARAGARSVDLTLPALADGCIEALGPRVAELWR